MRTMCKSRWFLPLFALGRGNPYTWLGALGGVAYLAALVAMRLRG